MFSSSGSKQVVSLGAAIVVGLWSLTGFAAGVSSTGTAVSPVHTATVTFQEMAALDAAQKAVAPSGMKAKAAPWMPVPKPGAAKAGAGQVIRVQAPATPPPAPLAPALTTSFEASPDAGTRIPPDTNGAVGPSHLMVPLNDNVHIQGKTGSSVSTVSLLSFWQAGFPSLSDVFDPKVVYDSLSGRFIFVTCAERQAAASSMLLGVSATSDPTGAWHLYQFDGDTTDTNWVDYPNLGVNTKWITFTSNMFANSDNSWAGVNIWVVDKSTALDGPPATSTLFFQTGIGGVLVPAVTFSAAETTQYLIQTWWGSSGQLALYTITGTAASPAFNNPGIFPTASAWSDAAFPTAPQSGSAQTIETNDDRMINAVLRNGSLWCAHAIALPVATPTHTAVKWWEINPATGTTIQSGVVDDFASGLFYFFPSLAVNANDEVLLGFSGSSSTTFASAYYTFRSPSDASNSMQSVSLLKAGETAYYKTFSGTENRWGDYSNTCVDPSDDLTLWTVQEYAASPANTWGTWWGKLSSPSASTPSADFSSATYSVNENAGTVTITVNLSAAPGTGNTATIDYATSNGTATQPADYTSASGTLNFGAADTSKTFTVTIVNDGTIESNETITLTLSSPSGATLAGTNNPATLTIIDDDVDTDGDGISNYDETSGTLGYVTNPNNADTDGDTFNDLFEIQHSTDPTNSGSFPTLGALKTPFFR